MTALLSLFNRYVRPPTPQQVEINKEKFRAMAGFPEFAMAENGDFQYLFYTTHHMLEDLCSFSDVLVMDTTYKVNKYLYPLVNVVCTGGEGCGCPVLHGFVHIKQSQCLLSCLEFLKSVVDVHPTVFFVNKDFDEVCAICVFRVSETKCKSSFSQTSSVSPENRRPEVTETVKAMMSAALLTQQVQKHIMNEQHRQVLPQDVSNMARKLIPKLVNDSEGVERLLEGTREEGR